ncbi:MAG: lipocalin family protein [Aeriscardovia sp.]|nr:lipocalin family protein [Aeriscardovia sp.]
MKKTSFISLLFIAVLSTFILSFCSKDDDKEDFAYPLSTLYGKWDVTDIQIDGKWYDVTKYPYTKFGMSIRFYENRTFYGSGYLGNGSGTYKLHNRTITTYINNGEEYIVYTVNSLTGTQADLYMIQDGSSIRIKAKKDF